MKPARKILHKLFGNVSATRALFAAIVISSVSTPLFAQDPGAVGVWMYPTKRFDIAIVPCGEELCGKIAWLQSPNDAGGHPRVDCDNTDPALRTRPLLGLTVLTGLHQVDDHTWEGGTIYNPDGGGSYSATLSVESDGTLHVHAYMLVAMLGKTIVMTRVS